MKISFRVLALLWKFLEVAESKCFKNIMINALSFQCISDRLPEIVGRAPHEPDDHYVKPFVLETGIGGPVILL